jgi:catechol 2,3-dioxygenase-like lactoylglutathione lyase family enzyme
MTAGRHLAATTLLVRDCDEAIAWFRGALGFVVAEDSDLGGGARWVRAAPAAGSEATILLARAATPGQQACIGRQAGGRVFLFLHTEDVARDHARMRAAGVEFRETPRREAHGTVAMFEDLCGNPWDLIERAR